MVAVIDKEQLERDFQHIKKTHPVQFFCSAENFFPLRIVWTHEDVLLMIYDG